jgi:hypothetical protein
MAGNWAKFAPGSKVRYILNPARPMIVVSNDTKYELLDSNFNGRTVFTGKVKCSWVDQNGDRQEGKFAEEELEHNDMWEDQFQLDTISIISKRTGCSKGMIKAHVQSGKISITPADEISIDPGDKVIRHIDGNRSEEYDVLDADFQKAWPPHFRSSYSLKVRKSNVPDNRSPSSNTVVHMYGPNSRFNQNSKDSSINIINQNNDQIQDKIAELQLEIENLNISKQEKFDALELVEALDEQLNSPKPKMILINTIIQDLSKLGAEIATIGTFIWQLAHPEQR